MKKTSQVLWCFMLFSLTISGQSTNEIHVINWLYEYPDESQLADMDGDGDLDVVYYHIGETGYGGLAQIAWAENDGYGGFLEVHNISVNPQRMDFFAGNRPVIEIADIDNDGDLDVATIGNYDFAPDGTLFWLENDGNGQFEGHEFSGINYDSRHVVLVDFNLDGHIDALNAVGDYGITYHENDGLGGFANQVLLMSDGVYEGVSYEVVDYDGDSDLDIIYPDSQFLKFWENEGGMMASNESIITNSGSIHSIKSADINADGILDFFLIYGLNELKTLTVHVSEGGGDYSEQVLYSNESIAYNYILTDQNNDGQIDLVMPRFDELTIELIQNSGGVFGSPTVLSELEYAPTGLSLGDINGDGTDDMVVTMHDDHQMGLLAADGSGGLNDFERIPALGLGAGDVDLVDFDDDGHLDIMVCFEEPGVISWFKNLGGAHFSPQRPIVDLDGAITFECDDINEDGHKDIVACSRSLDQMFVYWGETGGGFSSPELLWPTVNARDVLLADVDGDGDLDIIGHSQTHNAIFWIPNDGNSEFGYHVIVDESTFADDVSRLLVHDFEGDGDIDILADGSAWYINYGNGAFDSGINTTVFGSSTDTDAAIMDIDGDGDEDVIKTDESFLWFSYRQADDTYTDVTEFEIMGPDITDDAASAITLSDLDQDGDIDIICGGYFEFKVLWNQGSGLFVAERLTDYETRESADIVAGDLNGDGGDELVAVIYESGGRVMMIGEQLGVPNGITETMTDSERGSVIGPNPVQDRIYLFRNPESLANVSYSIVDINGRLVSMSTDNVDMLSQGLDISYLKNGAYILLLESDEKIMESLKFIKE